MFLQTQSGCRIFGSSTEKSDPTWDHVAGAAYRSPDSYKRPIDGASAKVRKGKATEMTCVTKCGIAVGG